LCTLIAGLDVLGDGTLLIGANRDESPKRPATDPGVLREHPRIVGGRDLIAGGTWLAIREGRFVTALMNRRPAPGDARDPSAFRSRGLLCLDAAAEGPSWDAPHAIDPGTGERHPSRRDAALRVLARDAYAHCTLIGLGVDGEAWAIHAGHGGAPRTVTLAPGWHVITHADVDDSTEPRTAWLMERIRDFSAEGAYELLERIAALLRQHADADSGTPGVCLHRERFPTVSSTLLALGNVPGGRYLHAGGPPCVTPYRDVSELLA
jgi:hypothetical protein